MKWYIALMSFLVSVAIHAQTPQNVDAVFVDLIDYRQYSKADFLITPTPYYQEYESCGELNIVVIPKEGDRLVPMSHGRQSYTAKGKLLIDEKELVGIAVSEAQKLGANAIVDFSITGVHSERSSVYIGNLRFIEYSKYIIKGFCIKRK